MQKTLEFAQKHVFCYWSKSTNIQKPPSAKTCQPISGVADVTLWHSSGTLSEGKPRGSPGWGLLGLQRGYRWEITPAWAIPTSQCTQFVFLWEMSYSFGMEMMCCHVWETQNCSRICRTLWKTRAVFYVAGGWSCQSFSGQSAQCRSQKYLLSKASSVWLLLETRDLVCISHTHRGQLPHNASHIYFNHLFLSPSFLSSTICNYRSSRGHFGLYDRLLTHPPSPTNFRHF